MGLQQGYCGPVQEMLERITEGNPLRFHTPGHKGLVELPGVYYDLTELPGSGALYEQSGGILAAEKEAKRCWHSKGSFLLVNGSTAGIQAMLLWSAMQGLRIALPRDCHMSAVYACAIAGIQPLWLGTGWNAEEQITQWDGNCLANLPNDGKSALLLTYPDYYGRCIDINAITNKLHGITGALLIDSAHGAHFSFSSKLPQDAGTWADLWVSGAHKTLPAPTQTAFLHAADERNAADIVRMLRGITTTSPSWMLLAGLDNGRVMMQHSGVLLDELIGNCMGFCERINKLDGLRCWGNDDVRAMGYGALDPTRLVVDVSGLGLTGWEAGSCLRELGIQPEMCDLRRVVMIATIVDGVDRLQQLYKAYERLAAGRKPKQPINETAAPPKAGEAVMTLRQAWLSRAQAVPMGQAEGRIAAEPFGAYPPGIPLCMPGERISRIALDAIENAKALGGNFIGVREGMVCVVED